MIISSGKLTIVTVHLWSQMKLTRSLRYKYRGTMMDVINPQIIRDHFMYATANERRCYIVTSSLIGWAHTQNDPWVMGDNNIGTLDRSTTSRPDIIFNDNMEMENLSWWWLLFPLCLYGCQFHCMHSYLLTDFNASSVVATFIMVTFYFNDYV